MKVILALLLLAVGAQAASDVQWTRFRGKIKAINYKTSTVTLDSAGDLVTIKVDDDVAIFTGKEIVPLKNVSIDDKVTLLYAPKAPAPKEAEEPTVGGVYPPSKR